MIKLECWLPEKEMFGVFSLDSIAANTAKGGALELIVSNDVFQFIISFPAGVDTFRVTEAERAADLLNPLRAEYEVLMRGNTFFKLSDSQSVDQFDKAGAVHYLVASPNYVVDVITDKVPSITLAQAKKQ